MGHNTIDNNDVKDENAVADKDDHEDVAKTTKTNPKNQKVIKSPIACRSVKRLLSKKSCRLYGK